MQNITVVIVALVVHDPMTKILMIRHGQSVANVEKYFAGHLNSPLTPLGVRQAQFAAKYIFEHYKVDHVYASDLDRAFVTGKAVADLFRVPVKPQDAFREIFAGQWEGKHYSFLPEQFPMSYGIWLRDIGNAECDGGESVLLLQERVIKAVKNICIEHPDETIVIATHATPIRSFQCFCEGKNLDQMKDIPWVSNGSISSFVYDNGVFVKEFVSFEGHLGELTSVLPKNC